MADKKIHAAIVGCGNIAKAYAKHIKTYPHVELAGFYDLDSSRAEALAGEFGGRVYPSLEDVLNDRAVQLIANLTIHHVHAEIVRKCLQAGKHVHTEKPLALSGREAHELVALAESKGLRLSSAPITYMGEAQQTFAKLVRDGKLGTVRLAYAEVNHGRIEDWHPNPEPFYAVGPLWDVGVYPVTLLTSLFGPVREVGAFAKILYPDRKTKEGRPFRLQTPDFMLAFLEFENGLSARLTANFYAKNSKQAGSIELHGDLGRAYVGDFQRFSAPVDYGAYGQPWEPQAPVRPPFEGIEFGRGVDDLARAILENKPHRASGRHAAHVIDVLEAIETAARSGARARIESAFPMPDPMEWAR